MNCTPHLPISFRNTVIVLGLTLAACFIATATTLADEPPPAPATRLTKSYFSKFFLRFSPDGSHIAYSTHYANRRAANQILVGTRLMKADGSDDKRILTKYDSQVQMQEHPCWSPDGKHLLISGGGNDTGNSSKDVFIADVDEAFEVTNLRKHVVGEGVKLGEEPCYSPDGKNILVSTPSEQLYVFDADGMNPSKLVQVDGLYCHQPDWSPDGQWIAFASDRDGNIEIYKIRWDGTELTRVTESPGIDARPRWSPDGEWILFTSNRTGNQDLHVMRHDGSLVRNLTLHPAVDDQADWHPSGKSIAFVSMRDGGFDVYSIPVPEDLRVSPDPPPSAFPKTSTGDLVAYYSFDRMIDGNLIRDQIGRNHMSVFDAKVVEHNGQNALEFDGEKTYGVCGNGADLRLGGPMTLSFWVRPTSDVGNGYIVSKFAWNVYLGQGVPNFETRDAANSNWDTLRGTSAIAQQQWSHIAVVFDKEAGKLRMYVNGQLASEKERTDGELGNYAGSPLEIGHYVASRSQKFKGQLDEFRIYRVALSAEKIAEEFQKQSAVLGVPDGK
ncbi:MAG: LamG-like jellyroll fold domain-containing protein [Planctomycetaceae bacterium]